MKAVLQENTYRHWQSAAGGQRVAISNTAIDEIRSHVIASFRSGNPRPEAGGALLGSIEKDGREIVIDSFEPLQIEHKFGPAYALSEKDYNEWREWLRALRRASPRLVGLCRSHTRPGLRVAPEDNALIGQFLESDNGALLLVKPISNLECVGAFFPITEGRIIDGATTGDEFPFAAVEPQARPKPPKTRKWIPVTAVATGVLAAGLLHWTSGSADENPISRIMAAPAPASALHLRAKPLGASIRLEWDRQAPVLAAPADATVSILDGSDQSTLRLSSADREHGYLEWTPHAPETVFVMRVVRPGTPSVTESVRVENRAAGINSSSDSADAASAAKPSAPAEASAPTGEGDTVHVSASTPRHTQRSETEIRSQNQGSVRRLISGITTKASHLWPFHSDKPEQPIQ